MASLFSFPSFRSAGVVAYVHVGEHAPTEPAQWVFAGTHSRRTVDVVLPPDTRPGTRVWVAVAWYSRRGQRGPLSNPVTSFVAGGEFVVPVGLMMA